MPKKFVRDARRAARAAQTPPAAGSAPEPPPLPVESDDPNSLIGSVVIAAGTTFEIPVLAYEGCVLVYSFKSVEGDLAFGVGFQPDPPNPASYGPATDADDDARLPDPPAAATTAHGTPAGEIAILPTKRYASHQKEVSGTLRVGRSGTATLKWDNSFSYFNSKTLNYAVELEEPLGGQGGPRPLGGTSALPDTPKVVFVLGSPGSGKGTQCARLAAKYGFLHVSAGDLLRAERANPNSQNGALISSYIKEGKIVPVEITCTLLWRAIRQSARRVVLVDGFPRNEDNLQGWIRKIGNRADVACVLALDCPDEVVVKRLLERGKSSGREDDNEESIKKRLVVFHGETKPIQQYYDKQRRLVTIDSNRDPDVVFADVEKALTSVLGGALPPPNDFVLAAPHSILPPRVILGTMTIGGANGLKDQDALALVREFLTSPSVAASATPPIPPREVDTANMYGGGGDTEKVLGRVLPQAVGSMPGGLSSNVKIATKVNPFPGFGASLSPTSIAKQFGQSLASLNAKAVDILYLHAPDPTTPLEVTLEACNTLHMQGSFKELGLSNFPAWQVVQVVAICQAKGFVKPTVYQGMYNPLTRDVEKELIPALRQFGLRFYAYNPLAGGLLTSGRYLETGDELPEAGRFGETPSGAMYRDRYWKPSYFSALALIDDACRKFSVTVQDAALRWLAHHSMLRAVRGDGIIVGASSVKHLKENCDAARTGGALPLPVVVAIEEAWEACRADCPKYFRP